MSARRRAGEYRPWERSVAKAAKAIRDNPNRSDATIAAELGIGRTTVQRAREFAHDGQPDDGRRIGQDGKSYQVMHHAGSGSRRRTRSRSACSRALAFEISN